MDRLWAAQRWQALVAGYPIRDLNFLRDRAFAVFADQQKSVWAQG